MRVPVVSLSLLFAGLLNGGLLALEPLIEIIPIDGSPVEARLMSMENDSAKFLDDQNRERTLTLSKMVRWGSLVDPKHSAQVLLVDGSMLIGRVTVIDEVEVVLETKVWGDVTLERTIVSGILWEPPTDAKERGLLRDSLSLAVSEESVTLINGDRLTGRVLGASDQRLEIATAVGDIELGVDRLQCWHLAAPKGDFAGNVSVIGLRDGTRLTAVSAQLDSKLQVTLRCGLVLTTLPEIRPVSESLVTYVRPQNDLVTYLSDVAPIGHKHIPLLSEQWDWQANRNVLGGPLISRGAVYDKGIGMHSTSRLAFELETGVGEFQAEASIDDTSGTGGSVIFRVFTSGDGTNWEQAYQSPVVRGQMQPVPIRVPLDGVKRLALVVDHADHGDVLDRANWLGARLVGHFRRK